MEMPAVDLTDESGSRGEVGPSRFSADRFPVPNPLLVAVQMQVPRKTQHKSQHVVGNHIGEESAHVAQLARVLDQRVEHVVLETGRRGLHPAQPFGLRQQRRSDLSEVGIRIGDLGHRRDFVGRVDDCHWPRRFADQRQSLVFDGRKEHKLHGDLRNVCEDVVKWRRVTLEREKNLSNRPCSQKRSAAEWPRLTSISNTISAGHCEASVGVAGVPASLTAASRRRLS